MLSQWKRALSDPKTRLLLLIVAVVLFLIVTVSVSRIREATQGVRNPATKSAIQGAPIGQMDPTPGNPRAPQEYKNLQEIENKLRVQVAEEKGKSAIPTLIRNAGETSGTTLEIDPRNNTSSSGAANTPSPQAELTQLYQQQLLTQQRRAQEREQQLKTERDLQDIQQRMAVAEGVMKTQLNALFERWTPPKQVYVVGSHASEAGEKAGAVSGARAADTQPNQIFAKAGDIFYAVLETGVDSDNPSPVMARVVDGPFKGARAVGSLTRQQDKVVLHFTSLNIPGFPRSVGVNAVAIDSTTAHTALASEVDHHYLLRYGTLFASSFLSGAASTLQGATTNCFFGVCSTSGGQTTLSDLSNGEKIWYSGLGEVGKQMAKETNLFNTPPTVTVDSGTGIGLLLLADLATQTPAEAPKIVPAIATPPAATGQTTNTGPMVQNLGAATVQLAQSLAAAGLTGGAAPSGTP